MGEPDRGGCPGADGGARGGGGLAAWPGPAPASSGRARPRSAGLAWPRLASPGSAELGPGPHRVCPTPAEPGPDIDVHHQSQRKPRGISGSAGLSHACSRPSKSSRTTPPPTRWPGLPPAPITSSSPRDRPRTWWLVPCRFLGPPEGEKWAVLRSGLHRWGTEAPLGDRGAGSWLAGSVGDRGAALEVAHTGELRMSAPSPTGSPFQGLVDVLAVCVILGASVFC